MKLVLKKGLVFAIGCCLSVSMVYAQSTQKPVLQLENAISMAISNDDTLARYSRNINVYEEQKKCIDNVASYEYTSLKTSISEAEQNKLYRKDVLEKNVTEAYQNLVLLEKNIDLLENQIKLNEKQVKQAEIKKEKGYCDELSYEKILRTLEDNKISKEQAEKKLVDAQKSFLKLTNIDPDKYTLEVDASYEPFKLDKNINEYASGMATQLVKYMDRKARESEENFWETIYQSGPDGGGPTVSTYVKAKADVENNKDAVTSTYDTYKLLIETKYTEVNKQMDTVKQKAADYDTASKDLKVLEIKYNAGYVSAIDYEAQKVALETKQVEYLQNLYDYNILKLQIQKPWVFNEYDL